MTRDEPFLRAIVEDPEDDAPRLVYADWLDEHGDPARAEFIRVQVRLATLSESDPQFAGLWAREKELRHAYSDVWRKELPRLSGINWLGFWRGRGFISSADVMAWRCYRTQAPAIFAATPIQSLRFFSLSEKTCHELVQSSFLGRLSSLDLSG